MSWAEYRSGRDDHFVSDGTVVRRTPSFGLKAQGRLAKLAIMLSYLCFGMLYSLAGSRVDRNVFLTQPPLFFVWGFVLRLLRRQPYYIVLMDLYPDVAIQGGLLSPRSLMTKLLLRLSRFGLCHADGVIVIGRCMQARLVDLGVPRERIHFIPNWTDQTKVAPVARADNLFRQEMGWTDKFVVMYSGNIGTSHYFDDLLVVCRRLKRRTDIVFVFIGHGRRRPEIEAAKTAFGLSNVVLLPFQPMARLSESLSAADVHFVSLRNEFTGLVVPSKVYGVLAVGRPVIYQGRADGEMAHLITDENIGVVLPINDADALEAAILTYVDGKGLAVEQGLRARALMETTYRKEEACRRYSSILGQRQ